jgi:methylornithine synthase
MEKDQIIKTLTSEDPMELSDLYSRAREARTTTTGDQVFLYGFVYFTTWCRNNCAFCYYRRGNPIDRYRKTFEETKNLSMELAKSGVHLIDLTMGEDPEFHKEGFKSVMELTKTIKSETGLPVMISPGHIPDEWIDGFEEAGADWYALYQETHNRELFSRLRLDQSYDERMHAKLYAKSKGMLIEEGLLAGVGETPADIADSLLAMGEIGAKQMRIMSFVPQEGIPMHESFATDRLLELKVIALLRIMYPYALIPASLDVDGIAGLRDRLNAGANVVTSIIPPASGLMGVAQSSMDVDEGGRTVLEASLIISDMGMQVGTPESYKSYLTLLKNMK